MKDIYDLRIIVQPKKGTCQIKGSGDQWLDLALLLEAVGMCMHANRKAGISPKKIEKIVKDYVEAVKDDYKEGGELLFPVK